MQLLARHVSPRTSLIQHITKRRLATPSASPTPHPPKATGDISSVFPSLSSTSATPLPPRFASLKHQILSKNPQPLLSSFHRLLRTLRTSIAHINSTAPSATIPSIPFTDITHHNIASITAFSTTLRRAGCGIIRSVLPSTSAQGLEQLTRRYITTNRRAIKGFPATNPTVYELYWSPAQLLARAHPSVLHAQRFLLSHWHSDARPTTTTTTSPLLSTTHPVTYADRLRVRPPGDTSFALGPHVDGGSCERWEREGYGRGGGVYDRVFEGRWEGYDPWETSRRVGVRSDLYNGAGGCSVFRMFQGWMALSGTGGGGAGEGGGGGGLRVCPLVREATAYFLLRPFFAPRKQLVGEDGVGVGVEEFLSEGNWGFEEGGPSSVLQGAVPGSCQELSEALHPHLELGRSMVRIPAVEPGDYVVWHCDLVHAVDPVHRGKEDSSVLYIPACPLTESNAEYLVRQRDAFAEGLPGPDFPGSEVGEGEFVGRLEPDFVSRNFGVEGLRGMGLERWDAEAKGVRGGERRMLERANEILGFA